MTTRVLAALILVGSALLAWLAITYALVARALQAVIAVSLVYVALLALRGYRAMRDARAVPAAAEEELPWVTILIAARNEAPVIGATVAALASQDYGGAARRFDVLVVDDGSTDGTGDLARAAAVDAGAVQVLRRDPADGPRTKAAVLSFAHASIHGEVIAVVDADANVAPDFVSGVMAAWRAALDAAAIQAQRREHNRGQGWLAAAQDEEGLMDMASQCGRYATDGTAELRGNGMFVRRAALEAVGGWNPGALTEDLELSTRLVAAGQRIALAPLAEVGEEAVITLAALWRQRLRWAEGSLRRLLELGPGLVGGRGVPLARKLDYLALTTEFLIPPLFLTTIIASLATIPLPRPADWTVPVSLFLGYGLGSFLLALAGLAAHGESGATLLGRALRGALFLSHWLVIVPAALLRIAFGKPATAFVQTPRMGHLSNR